MALISVDLSFASPLFYFFLGVFLTLYTFMIFRKNRDKKIYDFEHKSVIKFYLNIFIQNKEEALKNTVKSKMSNKLVGSLAGALANNMVSDEKFTNMMGAKMCEMIPLRLADLGIKCDVYTAYAYENYLCISIDVISADARLIIEKKGGKQSVKEFESFLDIFGMPQLNDSIDDTVASIIGQKLQASLPAGVRDKMQDKIGR
jgi:hypothetical protein